MLTQSIANPCCSFIDTITSYPPVFGYSIYVLSFPFKISGMSGKPKGTTGNNSPLFYIYTVIYYLYYYVKKALNLEYNAGIQYGL